MKGNLLNKKSKKLRIGNKTIPNPFELSENKNTNNYISGNNEFVSLKT